jgi:hypothetical protein
MLATLSYLHFEATAAENQITEFQQERVEIQCPEPSLNGPDEPIVRPGIRIPLITGGGTKMACRLEVGKKKSQNLGFFVGISGKKWYA